MNWQTIFKWLILGVWFALLLSLRPFVDYSDSVLFFLVVTVLPGLALLVFLLGVATWLSSVAFRAFQNRQPRRGWIHAAFLLCGIAAIPAGLPLGDGLLVLTLGPALETATTTADQSGPIEATQAASIQVLDTFFFVVTGLAHDRTGRLGEMLPLDPETRPEDWQASMPELLRAPGAARHIWGNWWRVRLSMD